MAVLTLDTRSDELEYTASITSAADYRSGSSLRQCVSRQNRFSDAVFSSTLLLSAAHIFKNREGHSASLRSQFDTNHASSAVNLSE